uniref:Uncharacterized protein n=1 Tax=Lepeophtheirus salmonis TaxID=72036 RepID=A0A0K2TBS6_LEPSM
MGVVACIGKNFPPIFVERKEKFNEDAYIELLDKKVLPLADISSGATLFSLKTELRVIATLRLRPS